MKYLLFLLITGCTFSHTHIGIIHDYIFENSKRACESHGGLHYIVEYNEVKNNDEHDCNGIYYVRCQDQVLLKIESEVKYCFISESQIDESLPKRN